MIALALLLAAEADGLKDRGDGVLIVAEVKSCIGGKVFALASDPRALKASGWK